MLLEQERNYGLGMDALVIVCSRNTNRNNGLGMDALVIVCSWNTNRNNGLGMNALAIACSRNTNGIMVWAWMLWSSYALGTRTLLWCGHGCSGHRMPLEQERFYGLGIIALVIVCSAGGSTWRQRVCPAHRPWSLTSCKGILFKPPNAGSTRLRPTKKM